MYRFLAALACALGVNCVSAQTSDNNFCYQWNGQGACYGSRQAAETAMKALLPASYQSVIQPKTPRPSGYQPNAQGLEQWQVDYFIPDQPPQQFFPAGYSQGWAGAPDVCPSAGNPLYPALCASEDNAAYALYNHFKAEYPQCTFTDHGYQNTYSTPFSSIYEYRYRSRYGSISYTNRALPPSGS
jgi:hypothetical protein